MRIETCCYRLSKGGHDKPQCNTVSEAFRRGCTEYTDPTFRTDTTPQTEDSNTMLPANEAFRRGCESWLKWEVDLKFVAMTDEKSSVVYSVVNFFMFVPTLLTKSQILGKMKNQINSSKCCLIIHKGGGWTYKDVEFSIKNGGDNGYQLISLSSRGYIAR